MNKTEIRKEIKLDTLDEKQAVASFDNNWMHEKIKNKLIRVLAIILAITVAVLALSCNSSATNAEQQLEKEETEYMRDVENFRFETRYKVGANNQRIIEFKRRIESKKLKARAVYKNYIASLDQRNTDLKKRMDDYKADTEESWHAFKDDFNQDMNELGSALNNFFSENQ